MDRSHRALLLQFLVCMVSHCYPIEFCCGRAYPESPVLELDREFTATCVLSELGKRETRATADDMFWEFKNVRVPKERYSKINDSAISMTVNVTKELQRPLKCQVQTRYPSHNPPVKTVHGLFFTVGYPPEKPDHLSCTLPQSGSGISPTMTCNWVPGERDPILNTNYTLVVDESINKIIHRSAAGKKSGSVTFDTLPLFTELSVIVEVENQLGKVQSEELRVYPENLLKLNPPKDVEVVSEPGFPTSLLVRWEHPIDIEPYSLTLNYSIRYCAVESQVWSQVPPDDSVSNIKSFRLQYLECYTEYVVQVRCMNKNGGHWSAWSQNVTKRTPEDKPSSQPDLWRVITSPEGNSRKRVKLLWKDPVHSNGIILGYNLTIRNVDAIKILELGSGIVEYVLDNVEGRWVIHLRARNSLGLSPPTFLVIPHASPEPSPVTTVTWRSQNRSLYVNWECMGQSPTEFVLEWVHNGTIGWQREPGNSSSAVIKGALEKYKRYNVSVYPVYNWKPGTPLSTAAYVEQGAPTEKPEVTLSNIGKTDVKLEWTAPPEDKLCGFVTKYTVIYRTGNVEKSIVLPPSALSYNLKELYSSSSYKVSVTVSTVAGSLNSHESTFSTLKYASGEIELIVVLTCLGFLFFTVLTLLLGLNNKEMIKKHIWPQVPDPSNSTIANWSPDFPSRPETPKEGSLTDVSVVEVDLFEKKSLGEEDKTSLPLKKDKYLSEEHSSGIGGSSCMSSPRQSVSDSDEGDSGQTTASTVQYSSVVASGYKGQTPGQPPPVFARSESTQPLLGSEEHLDEPSQAPRCPRNPYFRRARVADEAGEAPLSLRQMDIPEHGSLGFCPAEEGSQQTTPAAEGPAGPAPSYMPQRNGYRPQ
ncbi:hypothetical protein COCON_G00168880 [Conger conger]|uniref:Fibronectin type-III domain-containing protein n=1 Tax=Conger conger TaxID=82655 RepID=A0A9Q1D852_CONCO|nr:hypothetical protein COCON_G00168880 [Conger conger]